MNSANSPTAMPAHATVKDTSAQQEQEVTFTNLVRNFLSLPDTGLALSGLLKVKTLKGHHKKSIGLLLQQHAQKQPNAPAIRFEDQVICYQSLNQQANQIARHLDAQGITSGDVVAVMLENRPELIITVLALMKLGAVAAMINSSQQGDVLLHSLNLVKPTAIIVGEELWQNYNDINDRLPEQLSSKIYYIAEDNKEIIPHNTLDLLKAAHQQATDNLEQTLSITLEHTCYYIFTSGTTGLPKASVMTHLRFFKAMYGMGLASMRLTKADTLYVSLPFYHNNALTVSLSAVLGSGACLAIARKFSVSRFWQDIRHFNATSFCYIGELCRYLLNAPAHSEDQNHNLRVIIGNGLRSDIWMSFKQRFNIPQISEFYGASESNLAFTNCFNLDKTCGFCPLSYQIIQYDVEQDQPIRDNKGFCIPARKGQTGLLITEINNNQPFDGYTDEAASHQKMMKNVIKKDDLWFNTGDLVLNQGLKHVAFVDRLGDTFRWKGENVATTEVESIMMEYSDIEHAVVYGIEIPNTDGRAGMATITVSQDFTETDWQALTHFLRDNLPSYSIPVFIRLRRDLEVTGTFKYRKVELKQEAYHLEKVTEDIVFLDSKNNCYQTLTLDIEQQINAGLLSF